MSENVTDNKPDAPGRSWLAKLAPAIVIALAVVVVGAIAKIPSPKKDTAATVIPPVNVDVITIKPVPDLPDMVELPGVVEVNSLVRVSAEVDGRIEKIPVVEGQVVAKGQELVLLNTDLLQADYDKAVADDECNVKEMNRVNELAAKKIATEQELDQARTRRTVSQATMKQAKARLDRSVIRSPLAGILDRLVVKEGEYAVPGMVMAQVVDIETVKVAVSVPERDVPKIRLQDEGKVRCGALEVIGKVTYMSQTADDSTRTARIEITVDNRNRCLRSGQIVRAFLKRGSLKDAVMIPLLAVIPLEDGKQVFCAKDGKALQKRISLGMIKGDQVQALPDKDRLEAGDKLIVAGQRFVSDGQSIKIQNDKKAAASRP